MALFSYRSALAATFFLVFENRLGWQAFVSIPAVLNPRTITHLHFRARAIAKGFAFPTPDATASRQALRQLAVLLMVAFSQNKAQ
tara:strand:- start:1705 stop:1959 length:255 start_codon:yes stop_codon:yes gene_type:complete